MLPDDTWAHTLVAALETLPEGVVQANPSETLRPSFGEDLLQDGGVNAPIASPLSAVGAVIAPIGQGGMGVVDRVEQRSIGRWVARKMPRADRERAGVSRRLFQEAWVTGFLEHPNIVPVYDIAADRDGRPQVLMREIGGFTWTTLLDDADALRAAFSVSDVLDWHLRVFVQVCHAIAYAHSKGVIHRDLKPDNVMVGRFGEVYVLDWGLALALDARHAPWIPRAVDERRLAGTPRFMAPEMVAGDGRLLSEKTDVYLLGAVLHYLLVGRPPHEGGDVRKLMAEIPHFRAEWPSDVPPELAQIADDALAPRIEARTESVDQLRDRVQRWLDTQRAARWAREAGAEHAVLRERLAAADVTRGELHARFATVRLGFQQAMREWPDHPDARVQLREATLDLARYEIAAGSPDAAEALIAQLDDDAPELRRAIDVARSSRDARSTELARRAADLDPRVGVRTRVFVALCTVAIWLVYPTALLIVEGGITYRALHVSNVFVGLSSVAIVLWARDSLSKTLLNRMIAGAALALPLLQLVSDTVSHLGDLTSTQAFMVRFVLWTGLSAGISVAAVPRLWPSTVGVALCTVAGAAVPTLLGQLAVLAMMILVTNITWLWGPSALAALRAGDGPPAAS